jgi:predicted esterase
MLRLATTAAELEKHHEHYLTMIGRRVRAALPSLVFLSTPGVALRAQDTTSAPGLVSYRIKPSSIDSAVTRFDGVHVVTFARTIKADAPLLLFLPGTGGRPLTTTAFQTAAARQGYRVIGLEYVDEPAVQQVCPREPDPDCAEKVRRKRIFGENHTSLIDDDARESIVARLTTLIASLDRAHPGEGWAQYLKNGAPDWTRIAVSGHSQGAGMAAYIAQRTLVARVVLFSSPWDSYGPRRTLAPWVMRGNGATPSERWYAAYHKKENTADLIERAYSALRIPREHVHAFSLELTAAPSTSPNPYHLSVVGNIATPRKADGSPAYLDEWLAMLGDVR